MNNLEFKNFYENLTKEFKELDKDYSLLNDIEKAVNDKKHRECTDKFFNELRKVHHILTKEQIEFIYGEDINFSVEEIAFRRGFHHGFCTARREQSLTEDEIRQWRHTGDEASFPPGQRGLKNVERKPSLRELFKTFA
jgi:hypothetical protein